ncbi:hypothetical protein HDU67_007623 [Dinochytrium kinnereticum]|nr:hypothetical protein HDU67_007623 [Dinochytrium kinnereticum]
MSHLVLEAILPHCDARTIVKLQSVCRHLRALLTHTHSLWRPALSRESHLRLGFEPSLLELEHPSEFLRTLLAWTEIIPTSLQTRIPNPIQCESPIPRTSLTPSVDRIVSVDFLVWFKPSGIRCAWFKETGLIYVWVAGMTDELIETLSITLAGSQKPTPKQEELFTFSLITGERVPTIGPQSDAPQVYQITVPKRSPRPYLVVIDKAEYTYDPTTDNMYRLYKLDRELGPIRIKSKSTPSSAENDEHLSPVFQGLKEAIGEIYTHNSSLDAFAMGNRILFTNPLSSTEVDLVVYTLETSTLTPHLLWKTRWRSPLPVYIYDRIWPTIQCNEQILVISKVNHHDDDDDDDQDNPPNPNTEPIPKMAIHVHRMSDGSIIKSMALDYEVDIHLTRFHLLLIHYKDSKTLLTILKLDDALTPLFSDLPVPDPVFGSPSSREVWFQNPSHQISDDGSRMFFKKGLSFCVLDLISGGCQWVQLASDPRFRQLECLVTFEKKGTREVRFEFLRVQF